MKDQRSGDAMTIDLMAELSKHGFQGRMIAVDRLKEAREDISEKRARGDFNEEFFREELEYFRFKPPAPLGKAKTLVLAAYPQPQVRLAFHSRGKSWPIFIPPTYSHDSDRVLKNLLQRLLKPLGYRVAGAALPLKLLAVRSGLAAYGRNNISYLNGSGSFHRLAAFFTDYPAGDEGSWGKPKMMDACRKCSACLRGCPTGAIDPDRFLLRAERCLTFLNERPEPFPSWVDPAWHHRLFGCMRCQSVCPQNRRVLSWTEDGQSISEDELKGLLRGVPFSRIPPSLRRKFARFSWTAKDYGMLPRNIKAVLANSGQGAVNRGKP
jgi:epoxyqueuosine reductase